MTEKTEKLHDSIVVVVNSTAQHPKKMMDTNDAVAVETLRSGDTEKSLNSSFTS